jgi:hypothetical protein
VPIEGEAILAVSWMRRATPYPVQRSEDLERSDHQARVPCFTSDFPPR